MSAASGFAGGWELDDCLFIVLSSSHESRNEELDVFKDVLAV